MDIAKCRSLVAAIAAVALAMSGCTATHEAPQPEQTPQAQAQPQPDTMPKLPPPPAPRKEMARPPAKPAPSAKPSIGIRGFAGGHHPGYVPQPAARPPATFPGVNRFPDKEPTGFLSTAEHPVSTFSVDVDTA